MPLVPHFNPEQPVPNNPFYYPDEYYIRGWQGPVIIGSGLTLDLASSTLTSTGGGGGTGTVTSIATGVGLAGGPITTSGTISLTNTGVTPGSFTLATITVDAQGRLTSASNGTAVTSIITGTGLTGGPITSTGTVSLANTAVTPGSYTYGSFTVDAQGRLTSASNGVAPVVSVTGTAPISVGGTATAPVISITAATTGAPGAVQLVNNTVTNDPTTALTAAQGYSLQQQINALLAGGGLTLAGTMDASTGLMLTVTTNGAGVGFAVGSPLPAPAAGNTNYFAIVVTPGTYNPPGGGGPYTATQGDWFLSNGATYDFLNVGYEAPAATTLTPGIVRLATVGETQTGVDATIAITPAGACATYVQCAAYTAKGDLLAASAASTPVALPVGPDDKVLIACSSCTPGMYWGTAVTASCYAGVGVLNVGCGLNLFGQLTPGPDGAVLTADSTCAFGMNWCTVSGPTPYILRSCLTAKGDILVALGASTPAALPVGTDGQILVACSACACGLAWAAGTGVTQINTGTGLTGGPITTTGTISLQPATALALGGVIPDGTNITVNGSGNINLGNTGVTAGSYTYASITVDAQGRVTVAGDGATPVLQSDFTAAGDLLVGTGSASYLALPIGTNGYVLTADSTCVSKVKWAPAGGAASATPAVEGIMYGCTLNTNTSLGNNSAGVFFTTGTSNTSIGEFAGCRLNSGSNNTATGYNSLCNATNATFNAAYGTSSLGSLTSGVGNVAMGHQSLVGVTTGCRNVAIGIQAGSLITTGCFNVAIGNGAEVATNTACCQLAIGPTAGNYWLTGDSALNIKPGAGVYDVSNSLGFTNDILTSTGAGLQWQPLASILPVNLYGTANSTTTQIPAALSTGQGITLSDTGSTGFIYAGSQVTALFAGVFNIQFSAQLLATAGGGGNVEIWFRKNGLNLANSNTRFSVKNANEAEVAALNYVIQLAATDVIELYWATDDLNINLAALASTMGGPAIPSVIFTIVPVGLGT